MEGAGRHVLTCGAGLDWSMHEGREAGPIASENDLASAAKPLG